MNIKKINNANKINNLKSKENKMEKTKKITLFGDDNLELKIRITAWLSLGFFIMLMVSVAIGEW